MPVADSTPGRSARSCAASRYSKRAARSSHNQHRKERIARHRDRAAHHGVGPVRRYLTFRRAEVENFPREKRRIWINAHKAAVANFLTVLGADKPIAAVTRSDANAFRRWWSDRVADEGLEGEPANIQIGHIAVMLDRVALAHDLELTPVFAKMKLPADSEQGASFPTEWIRDRLLAPGALDGLNDEARRVIYVMTETGLRPSEICGLDAKSIMLNTRVPHLAIAPNEHRGLKTKKARRLMPLVGVALKAMQAQPQGFPRYAGKAPSMSAVINQYLRANNLMPSEEHTLYSLRHSFKDRLREIEPPSELIDKLWGIRTVCPTTASVARSRKSRAGFSGSPCRCRRRCDRAGFVAHVIPDRVPACRSRARARADQARGRLLFDRTRP